MSMWSNLRRGAAKEHAKEKVMLSWTVLFLVIALLAALFGFTGIAGTAAGIAQILFFIFLVVFLISLVMGLARGRTRL
jgi:uncharacterized membrane protein YtjA (UPF0391 family)